MKKIYLVVILAFIANFANAQIEQTNYRGAFAPAPAAMWTDSWTNWDPKNEPYTDAATVVNVTTDITANTTWLAGTTYKIAGLIYVRNNATLTIQPGVIVKGVYTNTGTALVICQGAKLNAIGTASSPIVFTSAKTVQQGRQLADWGGIILLGKAGFNLNNGVNNIEGITASVNTLYGGGTTPNDEDSSGTMKYVRIEFGGFVFSPNNEINGLTFGAVGRGTTIDNVQVSYSGDDSFEWFGGSVNCKHLVAYRGLDDDFDTDNGFKGRVQFCLGIRDPSISDNPAISTSEGFESDNNAAGSVATNPLTDNRTSCIFTNCTLIGPAYRATLSPALSIASGHARAARLRRASEQKIYNSIFLDFKNNFLFVDGTAAVANANAGTLKFKNNILAGAIDATYPGGVNPTSLNTWFSTSGNTIQSSSAGILTAAYGTSSSDYLGLDYRPGTVASSGADFTDTSIAPYVIATAGFVPVVANKVYCKNDIVTTPLTATLTNGATSLNWYTVATLGTASTVAPTPVTTTIGVKSYWVSQVSSSNNESPRVLLTVTTNALPSEVIGTMVGVGPVNATTLLNDSAIEVGKHVGSSTTFTYTIPAFVDSTLTYLWTVPNGVNIISGQGTRSITVNYLNVPGGAGTVGSISVQAVNASGCKTNPKYLTITKALPTATATVKLTEGSSTTLITDYAKYMGQTTPLTLTAGAVDTAKFYNWELPTGVMLSIPAGIIPVTTSATFSAKPFVSPAPVPSAVGTIYWVVTYNTYTFSVNGVSTIVTVATADQKIWGNSAYGGIKTQPYTPFGTVINSDKNAILVSFQNLVNPSTTALYFGVKTGNSVGTSITNNATNLDVVAGAAIPGLFDTTYTETFTPPISPSTNGISVITASGTTAKTSKLVKFFAKIPTAPYALNLTNTAVSTSTAVTVVSKFIGTPTVFTLTATASTNAASYLWELPAGVNQLSGGNSNVITVNFANVVSGITSLNLGVKAVNGIGNSVTVNAGLTSTAKLLKLTASVPAVVSVVAGQIAGVCNGSTKTYTITASPLANSYKIVAPVGSMVTSASNTTNNSNELTTSDLMFNVMYPANLSTLTPKTLVITSINGVGNSLTNKILTLTTTGCTGKMAENIVVVALINNTKVYPNPTTGELNISIDAIKAGTVDVQIYSIEGLTVKSIKSLNLQEGANTINENISNFKNGIYFVKLTNTSSNEVMVKRIVKQ